jgi:hypothetical protein
MLILLAVKQAAEVEFIFSSPSPARVFTVRREAKPMTARLPRERPPYLRGRSRIAELSS